jgi:hypothetical protein
MTTTLMRSHAPIDRLMQTDNQDELLQMIDKLAAILNLPPHDNAVQKLQVQAPRMFGLPPPSATITLSNTSV